MEVVKKAHQNQRPAMIVYEETVETPDDVFNKSQVELSMVQGEYHADQYSGEPKIPPSFLMQIFEQDSFVQEFLPECSWQCRNNHVPSIDCWHVQNTDYPKEQAKPSEDENQRYNFVSSAGNESSFFFCNGQAFWPVVRSDKNKGKNTENDIVDKGYPRKGETDTNLFCTNFKE